MLWNGIVGQIDIFEIISIKVTDSVTDNLSENMTTRKAIASKNMCIHF